MRRIALRAILATLLFALFLTLMPVSFAEEEQPAPVLRALLIGCDRFITMQDTAPGAAVNLNTVKNALGKDLRGYESITPVLDGIGSREAMENTLAEAFEGADDHDISFIYISTHGIYAPEGEQVYSLVLSDGRHEYYLDCRELRKMLDEIPGTKVLVFDACNSGYMIGKGMGESLTEACFSGDSYKVITSCGGEENSFYWKNVSSLMGSTGSSFFCSALCDAIGMNGSCPADTDGDGLVTLSEVSRCLAANYGTATARVYPQNDSGFVFYSYDAWAESSVEKTVTDIRFDSCALSREDPDIEFGFTVNRPAQLYYQVVYYKNGMWDFAGAVYYGDSEGDDRLSPGVKRRVLSLSYDDAAQSGYLLLQFFTVENGRPVLQSSRVLGAGGDGMPVNLSVSAPEVFTFSDGAEMKFTVSHDVPCLMTVSVEDEEGNTVLYLCSDTVTRPESPLNTFTYLCWDGKDRKGNPVPGGVYTLRVQAESCDGLTEAAVSGPIEVLIPAASEE